MYVFSSLKTAFPPLRNLLFGTPCIPVYIFHIILHIILRSIYEGRGHEEGEEGDEGAARLWQEVRGLSEVPLSLPSRLSGVDWKYISWN